MRKAMAKNKKLVWLSLLVYLLTGFGPATWCFSDEGGCGLESAGGSCCVPNVPDFSLEEASCGPCVDIDLAFPSLKSRSRYYRAPAAQGALFSPPPPSELHLRSVPSSPPQEHLLERPSLALLQLRTVVLLN